MENVMPLARSGEIAGADSVASAAKLPSRRRMGKPQPAPRRSTAECRVLSAELPAYFLSATESPPHVVTLSRQSPIQGRQGRIGYAASIRGPGLEPSLCPRRRLLRRRPTLMRLRPSLLRRRPRLIRARPGLIRRRPGLMRARPGLMRRRRGLICRRPGLIRPRLGLFRRPFGMARHTRNDRRSVRRWNKRP